MIKCIKETSTYKSLNLSTSKFHAYLFYSNDKELNNSVAISFANSFVCENNNQCGQCSSCKQFIAGTHPDSFVVDKDSIKVEDVNNIISKQSTLPVYSKFKVFVILNAENINELAQNKLLKSIEEPTSNSIFIFTSN